MRHVLILHGWGDSSESFQTLASILRKNGYKAIPLWLGDYISRDDDVSIEDVAKRMEEVLQAAITAGQVAVPFDMVVHSTGGLVARTWLTMFDAARGSRWLQRLVMLAPANYGSRLASLGKSMVGRLTRGLSNGLQTGRQMLEALELGSPFQWKLALADVLHDGSFLPPVSLVPYSESGCLPFVITGVKGYDSILRRPLNEDGADGTVRAAAANLTSHGLTLDFTRAPAAPQAGEWSRVGPLESFAFVVLGDVDHGSIVQAGASVLPRLLEALACPMDRAAYIAIRDSWFDATQKVQSRADATRHQYFQLNTFVIDDLGQPLADHFIEFSGGSKPDASLSVFQTDVIEHVHVNSVNGACRAFYLDRTDMFGKFYGGAAAGKPKELQISIWATPPGPNVTYFDPKEASASGHYRVHLAEESPGAERWLKRNCTHFLKIIVPRRPLEGVFRLNPYAG